MPKKLRSNFPYGSYLWAVRAAQWRALGIDESELEKPKIAIVNSSSNLAICFSHLDGIAQEIKQAIRDAGALPFEIRTAAPSDFITGAGAGGAYMLGARDLITNDIEVAVEGAQLDGMICLASCDKTVPGQLMAAARLNIPTLVVVCGYQPSGEYNGKHVDIEDVFIGSMHAVTGKLSVEELAGMARNAIKGPGVCSGMGTANSMHLVCEALGMALPGSSPIVANSPQMFDFVRQAGRRIVAMVEEDLKPRDILSPGAFANAVSVVLAAGGSVNCIKHLQAVAAEAGMDIDVYGLFRQLGDRIPVLVGVRPMGEHSIEQMEAAGGGRALLKQLEPLLDGEAMTVSGQSLAQNLSAVVVADEQVIRPLHQPFATQPAIVMLKGNIAPQAGIVKYGIDPSKMRRFSGPAICFERSADAIEALQDGRIQPGHVVVMRGAGVRGGPAMGGGASRVVFAIDGAGLGDKVAMLTDGHLSGLVCKGLVVAEVSPEAAVGGPLALLMDGDIIDIDLDAHRLDARLDSTEWHARRERWKEGPAQFAGGWLDIYRDSVSGMERGAVLIKPVDVTDPAR
ncbi:MULTISPECIES: dihydroxy-acid dehydratase [unclassified Pseudomonas]|uniref:dihydroxy-acid dehydratase n=1 Tax=unclassified Pseudomonas TaxID=196821 RepID=UPI000536E3B3|nr:MULTISPECIES: dihydroxy-acid dehydratase [unclassified Pseudomonas]MBD0686602.1 dihydroxy-acid dehydratase [Pseudomonas sp. PSB18]QKM21614.1 dihydroxy acid dehydratase [Pseudomonas sp. SHC52]CDF95147.1 Dihydroxy-acid dehydratase [Pseudomonas sp. SHC52]